MSNLPSEHHLIEMLNEGKITEEEYEQLLEATRFSLRNDSQEPASVDKKYVLWIALIAVVAVIVGAIYLIGKDDNAGMVFEQNGRGANATKSTQGQIVDKIDQGFARQMDVSEADIIVPKVGIGGFTLDMSKDAVLEELGTPRMIFLGQARYTLDNLPSRYYMVFNDISFLIVDDSVRGITALSSRYKFANGLGVGDSEQEIIQAFGEYYRLKETKWKDFLNYEAQGLSFEIHKSERTVMEINVVGRD